MNFTINGVTLDNFVALIDGVPDATARVETSEADGSTVLTVVLPRGGRIGSIGLRMAARGVRQYLRNGYMSWDGSFFVEPASGQRGR